MTYFDPHLAGGGNGHDGAHASHAKTFLTLAMLAAILGWLFGLTTPAGAASPFMEPNTDRYGGDYSVVELKSGGPRACDAACTGDSQCKAWTYVKPGIEGPSAMCHLKLTVPHAGASPCCVSGVRVGAGVIGRSAAN